MNGREARSRSCVGALVQQYGAGRELTDEERQWLREVAERVSHAAPPETTFDAAAVRSRSAPSNGHACTASRVANCLSVASRVQGRRRSDSQAACRVVIETVRELWRKCPQHRTNPIGHLPVHVRFVTVAKVREHGKRGAFHGCAFRGSCSLDTGACAPPGDGGLPLPLKPFAIIGRLWIDSGTFQSTQCFSLSDGMAGKDTATLPCLLMSAGPAPVGRLVLVW